MKVLHKNKKPISTVLKNFPKALISGIAITILPVTMIILGQYLPIYLKDYSSFSSKDIYFSIMIATGTHTLCIPIFGFLSSLMKKTTNMLITSIVLCLSSVLWLIDHHINYLNFFAIIYKIFTASLMSCYPLIIASLFPTHLRYSGVSISYNFAFIIATLLLLLSTSASEAFKDPMWLILLVVASSAFSISIIVYGYNKNKMYL